MYGSESHLRAEAVAVAPLAPLQPYDQCSSAVPPWLLPAPCLGAHGFILFSVLGVEARVLCTHVE